MTSFLAAMARVQCSRSKCVRRVSVACNFFHFPFLGRNFNSKRMSHILNLVNVYRHCVILNLLRLK